MKRSTKLISMLAVLAVLCAASFGVNFYQEKKEQIRVSDAVILSISPEQVKAVSWQYGQTNLSFHQEDGWQYDGDAAFPVDKTKLETTLGIFSHLGAAFEIESPEDIVQYGLDTPVCRISLETDTRTWEILLGDYSQLDAQRYVSIGDGNVYLVKEDPMPYFEKTLSNFILQDEAPYFHKVTNIRFSGSQNYEITTSDDPTLSICGDDTYFTERDGVLRPLETANVTSYLNILQNLSLTEYVTYNVSEGELAAFGLAEPELIGEISYENANGDRKTFTYSVGRNQEELAKAESDDSVTPTAYLRVGDSQLVYHISQSQYTGLMKAGFHDLRHDELLTADFADVTALAITLDGEEITITSELREDTRHYFCSDAELTELQLSNLRTAARSMRAASYTEETAQGVLELSVTYSLTSEAHPSLTIDLYRYDGTNCLAYIDGEPTCLVARTAVVDLMEAVRSIILG